MPRFRTRRRLVAAWRDHRWVDLGALILGAPAVMLPSSKDIQAVQLGFLTGEAAIVAILVAVVTFACAFIYQAQSPRIVEFRKKHAKSLQASWLWCVAGILAAAIATLAAIVVAYWSPAAAWAIACGVLAFAVALTVRALDFLRWALASS